MKRASQRRAIGSFAGFALLGLGGWLSVQVALAGRKSADTAAPPPPARTRSGERPLLHRERAAGDPVANYLARAKRGMTEREVRWMIEDFEAAGLDRREEELVDFSLARAHRKKLEEWYLAALTEGLSLSPEQKEEAKTKLTARFTRDLQWLEELEASGAAWKKQHPGQLLCGADSTRAMRRFYDFPTTLFFDSAFAPWNLADLTEEQTSLTLKFWRIEEWKHDLASDPFASGETQTEPDDWLYAPIGMVSNPDPFSDPFASESKLTLQKLPGVPAIQDPVTGNLTQVPEGYHDLPSLLSGDARLRLDAFLSCGNILPLTPDQEPLLQHGYDWAAQALLCHPAQLRLALLQQPHLAKILREQLDLEPSQRGLKLPPKNAAPLSSE